MAKGSTQRRDHMPPTAENSLTELRETDRDSFIKFGDEFRSMLVIAQREFEEIEWEFNNSSSSFDFKDLLNRRLKPITGGHGVLRDRMDLPGRLAVLTKLSKCDVAKLCGYHLIPRVAAAVVEVMNGPLLENLPRSFRVLKKLRKMPRQQAELRVFWEEELLPRLTPPPAIAKKKKDDPWRVARDRIVACEMLAGLLASPRRAEAAMKSKRRWRQNEVDQAIREYKDKNRKSYEGWARQISAGSEVARKEARKKFGRNAIADMLKCPKAMVSHSLAWKAISAEIQLAKQLRGEAEATGSIHVAASAGRADNPTFDAVVNRELIERVKKTMRTDCAEALIHQLETNNATSAEVEEILKTFKDEHSKTPDADTA